jgi:hypothetical protein
VPNLKAHHFAVGVVGGIIAYELYVRMVSKK